jgi:7-cyano-7-deazaguanine synthase
MYLTTIDLSVLSPIFTSSALVNTSQDIPEGHYEAKSMESTVVPNRNMILLSIAAAYAESIKADSVAYAAHSNDRAIYRDCRPEFIDSVAMTIGISTGVKLIAPFVDFTKADIVKLGLKIQAPLQLTWSCYNGREKACGKCGTCNERLNAFALCNTVDPIEYEIERK